MALEIGASQVFSADILIFIPSLFQLAAAILWLSSLKHGPIRPTSRIWESSGG